MSNLTNFRPDVRSEPLAPASDGGPIRTVAGLRRAVGHDGSSGRGLWFDTRASGADAAATMIDRVLESEYTGLIVYPDRLETFLSKRFLRLDLVLQIDSLEQWAAFDATVQREAPQLKIIASADNGVLDRAASAGMKTCLRAAVGDAPDLDKVIATGRDRDYVLLRFLDPTNIPLELVIAEFQRSRAAIFKEIVDPDAIEDMFASLGTMEVGAAGLVFTPRTLEQMSRALPFIRRSASPKLQLETASITASRGVGMGHRACVDLVTLFGPDEGILVGSTSQGGLLCCAEVFPLPYMESRPFRINAGGVHSYVYGPNNRTSYITELRAGQSCLVVDTKGETRIAPLGRVKIEVRPLRLLSCAFKSGEQIELIMQDDWHVRVFGGDGSVANLTNLRIGDELMAYRTEPGRHVGIQVSEFIREQ